MTEPDSQNQPGESAGEFPQTPAPSPGQPGATAAEPTPAAVPPANDPAAAALKAAQLAIAAAKSVPPPSAQPSDSANPAGSLIGGGAQAGLGGSPQPLNMPAFNSAQHPSTAPTGPAPQAFGGVGARELDLLGDVNLNVKIELGRTRLLLEDILRLAEGSVVELDKLAGDPVDVYVNDRPVARGEVLVLNDNFCVRINEILNGNDGATIPPAGAA